MTKREAVTRLSSTVSTTAYPEEGSAVQFFNLDATRPGKSALFRVKIGLLQPPEIAHLLLLKVKDMSFF